MQTTLSYRTLGGHTIDLNLRSKDKRSFFERCYELYIAGRSSDDFTQLANLVAGPSNPLVKETHGRITNAVWEHPLFQAVRDLEDRLGIRVGELEEAPGDDSATDPMGRFPAGPS